MSQSLFDASKYPAATVSGIPVAVNTAFSATFKNLLQPNSNSPKAPVYTKCVSANSWALTYDDGPSDPFTGYVLGNLTKRQIKGTFFVVGSQVLKNPSILKSVVDAGMEIGIHSWSHSRFTSLTSEQIISEVLWTHALVKEITGISCKSFRFPYGGYDNKAVNIVQGLGFNIIQWDRDTEDWKVANSASTTAAAFKSFVSSGGHITLEHDLQKHEVASAPEGQDAVLKAGYKPVLMSECLGIPSYGDIVAIGGSGKSVVTSTSLSATSAATSTSLPPTSTLDSTTTATTTTTSKPALNSSSRPKSLLLIMILFLSVGI